MLNKGAVFMKYGRKGSPHQREVFLAADGYLYWAKPGERQKKRKKLSVWILIFHTKLKS